MGKQILEGILNESSFNLLGIEKNVECLIRRSIGHNQMNSIFVSTDKIQNIC